MICESCQKEVIALLDQRISDILSHHHGEPTETESGDLTTAGIAMAECFHLMEMKHSVEGKPVAFRPAIKSIEGPLFEVTKGAQR